MNLRILKKLSKRAAPYLSVLGDGREQFRAKKGENYHGMLIRCRKNAERWPSCHTDGGERVITISEPRCRAGTKPPYIKLMASYHPLKGTMMVGAMSGYYEPEWDEECAFTALDTLVRNHFTDWEALMSDDYGRPVITRNLSTISKLFAAADEMVMKHRQEGQR